VPSAANISLPGLIYQQALAQGVPPSIALAVAQQESGVAQWTPSGGLVTGSAGEIGVFQLMPTTATGLGVDPSDVNENISGGISLLASLYQKYGNWPAALSAYNSGSPTGSPSYANSVLALAGGIPPNTPIGSATDTGDDDSDDSGSISAASSWGIDPNILIIGGLGLVLAVAWYLD